MSYSRSDIRVVSGVLRALSDQGFRIWYDQMGEGIAAGKDWRSVIDGRLRESRAFLIFLGYGSQNRTEVVRELEMAVKKQHKNPEYVILPVFLNRIPITDFPEQVRPVLIESQNIGMWLYGGVTERFIDRIVNTESWNCGVIDAEYRKKKGLAPWQPGVSGHENIEYRPEDQKTYIYH